jgi:hypothetical protein
VLFGDRDRVPQPQRIPLADVVDRRHVRDLADPLQLVELALGLEEVLELDRSVEVVLDRALAPAGDDQDVGQPRPHGLLDDVLDRRLVEQRQHLLRLGLRRRQEPRAESRSRDDRLADLLHLRHGPRSIPLR